MIHRTTTEARAEFSELINRVAYGGEPVVITRHGKALVALVPAALLDVPAGEDTAPASAVLDLTAQGRDDAQDMFTLAVHDGSPDTR